MRRFDAHGKLLTLMFGVLLTSGGLLLSGGGLLAQQPAQPSQSYDQVAESFEQIVPGMTRADDLPNLGFSAPIGNADILSYRDIQARFLPTGAQWEHLEPAVRACIRAELYCTGFVFRPSHTTRKRIGNAVSGLLRWQPKSPSADVVLLVMNGRVVHKVFSPGNPGDGRQPLAPLQNGGAMARMAGNTTNF
jgi:hypothetical protein